jgi:hypothetical protein
MGCEGLHTWTRIFCRLVGLGIGRRVGSEFFLPAFCETYLPAVHVARRSSKAVTRHRPRSFKTRGAAFSLGRAADRRRISCATTIISLRRCYALRMSREICRNSWSDSRRHTSTSSPWRRELTMVLARAFAVLERMG